MGKSAMSVDTFGTKPRRDLMIAGGIIGFALGGFFDGILLHQVLQWHHFLSLVEGETFRDLRTQILADGLFHVAVYLIAAVGLWLLWRARGGFSGSATDRVLLASALLGFSIWQFSDVVIFHWIIGIHRIRVGVPSPLLYDLGWMVVFGVPTLIAAILLFRGQGGGDAPVQGGPRRPMAASLLSVAVLVAGPVGAMGPPGGNAAMVLFSATTTPADAFAAVAAADGRVIWADSTGTLLAVDLGSGGDAWRLYRQGALLVSSSPVIAGCLAWSRV